MLPWWTGRTFYRCPCGGRDETLLTDPPATVKCWVCKGTMTQWVPPAVEQERKAG